MLVPVDVTGREPSTASLALRGMITAAVLAVVVALLLMMSRGTFEKTFPVRAVVANVGDGLPAGADVKLRGVLIGRVSQARVEQTSSGAQHVIAIDLKPAYATGVPASVKARIVPTNIFGSPSVELVPGAENGSLARNATIPGDDSTEALQLQTAMTKIRDVLAAVQPAKLNSALTSIADALDGRGGQIGGLITKLDDYVTELNRNAGPFNANVAALADALESLRANAPGLLDTVDKSLVTSKTVVDEQQQLVATLGAGAVTSETLTRFLDETGKPFAQTVRNLQPVVGTIANDSAEIPGSFRALDTAIGNLNTIFTGRNDHATVAITFSLSPFDPYTARDCPRYNGMIGPNCGNPVPANAGNDGLAGLLLGPLQSPPGVPHP